MMTGLPVQRQRRLLSRLLAAGALAVPLFWSFSRSEQGHVEAFSLISPMHGVRHSLLEGRGMVYRRAAEEDAVTAAVTDAAPAAEGTKKKRRKNNSRKRKTSKANAEVSQVVEEPAAEKPGKRLVEPFNILRSKLSKLLGRNAGKDDIILRYQVQMEIPALKATVNSLLVDSEKTGRRMATESILSAFNFDELLASKGAKEEGNNEEESAVKKETKKKDQAGQKEKKKKEPSEEVVKSEKPEEKKPKKEKKTADKNDAGGKLKVAELQVGQSLTGRVVSGNRKGMFVDVGASTLALLPAQEVRDGFPIQAPEVQAEVNVRVLKLNPFTVTMLAGDLFRAEWQSVGVDSSALDGVPANTQVDGLVVGFTFHDAILSVANPSDPSKVTLASLAKEDFAPGFADTATIGSTMVQVRITQITKSFVSVSMKDKPDVESVEVGQTVSGTVQSIKSEGKLQGVFVFIGMDRSAFLAWEECSEGWGAKNDLKFGDTVDVRVLKIQDRADTKDVYLTRRPGSLERPDPLPEAEVNNEAFKGVSQETWLDGTVLKLIKKGAMIKIMSPDGQDKAVGMLNSRMFSAEFKKTAAPGQQVKVRLELPGGNLTRGNAQKIELTMKGVNEPADAVDGD